MMAILYFPYVTKSAYLKVHNLGRALFAAIFVFGLEYVGLESMNCFDECPDQNVL